SHCPERPPGGDGQDDAGVLALEETVAAMACDRLQDRQVSLGHCQGARFAPAHGSASSARAMPSAYPLTDFLARLLSSPTRSSMQALGMVGRVVSPGAGVTSAARSIGEACVFLPPVTACYPPRWRRWPGGNGFVCLIPVEVPSVDPRGRHRLVLRQARDRHRLPAGPSVVPPRPRGRYLLVLVLEQRSL